jgi:dihydropyrimidinase
MTYDTVITDSHVILPQGMVDKNILIDEGKIVGFTNDVPACDNKINGSGLVSIPGPIDTHTHYGVYSPINEAAKTESPNQNANLIKVNSGVENAKVCFDI